MTREERSDAIRSRRYSDAASDLSRAIDRGARRAAWGAVRRMSRACDEHSVGGDETFDPRDPTDLLSEAAQRFGWAVDSDGWPTS